jgi:hypothetical protein
VVIVTHLCVEAVEDALCPHVKGLWWSHRMIEKALGTSDAWDQLIGSNTY